jgi:hypothetical protein
VTIRIKGLPLRILLAILHFIRKITTGKDNQTPDLIRIGGILLGFQFLLLAGWDAFALRNAFDPMAYGGGAAALLAAIGAALRLKDPTEE